MTPRVSVLVPSYNYAPLLRRCIDSVLAQRNVELELVISDDASTDDSDAIIRSYRDARVVYERQPQNLGMVPNWRRCAELASGEYLLLLGADDYLKPDMLARCTQVLDADVEIAFCHTAAEFFVDPGTVVSTTGAFRRSYVTAGSERIEAFLRGRRVVNSASVFRRSVFQALGGWSDAYKNCMDADLWFRMLLRGKVGYIGDILVGFRSHPVSAAWTLLQAEEDLRFTRAMFAALPPQLARLRALQPALERDQIARSLAAVSSLPASPEQEQVLARLLRDAGVPDSAQRPSAPLQPTGSGRAQAQAKNWKALLLLWAARLPAPLRHRLGDHYGG
jgi:GT2 family glycosyltransferase